MVVRVASEFGRDLLVEQAAVAGARERIAFDEARELCSLSFGGAEDLGDGDREHPHGRGDDDARGEGRAVDEPERRWREERDGGGGHVRGDLPAVDDPYGGERPANAAVIATAEPRGAERDDRAHRPEVGERQQSVREAGVRLGRRHARHPERDREQHGAERDDMLALEAEASMAIRQQSTPKRANVPQNSSQTAGLSAMSRRRRDRDRGSVWAIIARPSGAARRTRRPRCSAGARSRGSGANRRDPVRRSGRARAGRPSAMRAAAIAMSASSVTPSSGNAARPMRGRIMRPGARCPRWRSAVRRSRARRRRPR